MKTGGLQIVFCILLAFASLTLTIQETMATELKPHLLKRQFENGLTVIVKETPGVNVATVQIWVKAGSVYEAADEGGITHLIEHMIFKGTPTRGPGGLAAAIEEAGGKINAYTSFEYTVYHATLSARYWELAMDVLADAVLHSTFDPMELEREKLVVLEEIRMRNDRPTTKLFQELLSRAYTTHPYKLPVIGTTESVSGFTQENITTYIDKHYHPENFTVVVVGNVKAESVFSSVKNLMGGLPAGGSQPNHLPQEPEQTAHRFYAIKDDINQSHLALALPISRFNSPDSAVLDVIAQILGQGETSRLYNELRNKQQLVYSINASAFTPHDPGLFEVTATVDTEKAGPAIEAALEEIFKIKYVEVTDEELDRAKRNLESDFVFNLERVEGQARMLGSFEFLSGDPREDEYLEKIRAVDQEDIIRVASTYFTGNHLTTGVLVPANSEITLNNELLAEIILRADEAARNSLPPSLILNSYLPNEHFFKLKNGITLVVREDPDIPTVAVRVVFPGGLLSETPEKNGAFTFISELLPKGTKDLSTHALAVKIGNMAGSISGFNGKNTFGIKADFLSRFFVPGMELVRDVILTPAFDPQETEKIRPELLSQLKLQEDSLPSLAFREFNRLLFKGHPYSLNTVGSETALAKFTSNDLKAIYEQHAIPEKAVISVAGDVQAKEVRDLVKNLFSSWEPLSSGVPAIEEESFLAPDPPTRPEIFNIARDKEQVHIIIGFLGTSMDSIDRYPLEILDTVLSGQSGRLFTELRDKQSLAYSLSSFSLLGLGTGSFGIYIGTSPEKKDDAIKAVWKELYLAQEELISAAELQKAKNLITSQYEMSLQTHGSQAMEMALNETYKMGQDFGKRYISSINAVSAEQVLAAARKYIKSANYVLVSVGGSETPQPANDSPENEENKGDK
ncbi:MAG: insulinase family protein [Proteobacteria bacterium]|nr:insulinase family protein [Pseudomonadota bacterium]MBU1710780.1 insulinase family protein [Pseudomonadota bacterium]